MKLILILLLISFSSYAHNSPLQTYHVISLDEKRMGQVANEFEITRKLENGHEVLVPENKKSHFLHLVPEAELVSINENEERPSDYRTLPKVNKELKSLAAKYPHLAKLESYGQTLDGHVLYALKLSDNPHIDEDEPEIMITSATHGDEFITVEVTMELLTLLLDGYDKYPRFTKMINERELFFIPVVNPQGYAAGNRYANNIDPNRDYPYPGNELRKSVDCIAALRKFFDSRNIVGSLDFHASGKLIMYPWGYTSSPPRKKDLEKFEYLSRSMAEMNKYRVGQISKLIAYPVKGSSVDYYYWKKGTVALGIELTKHKAPPFEHVPAVVEEAKEMTWRFIENF